MGIYKAELGRMTLLVVLLLFFLFPLIKQGIAGGAGQASEPKNCIDVTSVQLEGTSKNSPAPSFNRVESR